MRGSDVATLIVLPSGLEGDHDVEQPILFRGYSPPNISTVMSL